MSGSVLGCELDRAQPVARLRDDLEVGLELEQGRERLAHEVLVIGEQQADHAAGRRSDGIAGTDHAADAVRGRSGRSRRRPAARPRRARRRRRSARAGRRRRFRRRRLGDARHAVVGHHARRPRRPRARRRSRTARRGCAAAGWSRLRARATRTAAAGATGTASGVPATAASHARGLQDADGVGELASRGRRAGSPGRARASPRAPPARARGRRRVAASDLVVDARSAAPRAAP